MSDKKPRDMSVDLSGFSDDQLSSLYQQSISGVRRQGYDGSNDTTVDYTPSAEDAIYASSAVTSDWEGGDWDAVRDKLPGNYSDEDSIHKMRNAVNSEYTSRRDKKLAGMQAGIDANTNRKFPDAKTEAAPEEKTVERPKLDNEMPEQKEFLAKDNRPDSIKAPKWNPDGGTEAPGAAQYSKAKEKADAYKAGSKIDYSFNAGGYGTSAPPTSANPGGTASADMYGNVSADEAASSHANNLLTKYKSGIKYGQS